MKIRSGLLVAALAVPLSFASQSQTSATQTEQRGTTNQQSDTSTQDQTRTQTDRTTTQSDRNTSTQGTPRESTGTATDQHGTSTSRTDRETGQSQAAGTRSRTGETAESMVSPADRKFMTEAAQGGVAEVQLAQLAQQKAASDEVKELAKAIEQDHQKANEELKTIATNRQVDLPAEPGPKHKQLMSRLEKLEGAAFDKAYTDAMVKEHKAEIKKFQKHAKSGLDTDVREFAESKVPALQKHLEQAQQASSSMRSRSR